MDPLSEYWQSERRNLIAKMYKVVHFYILIISFPVQGTLFCKIWFRNESVPIMVKLIKGMKMKWLSPCLLMVVSRIIEIG